MTPLQIAFVLPHFRTGGVERVTLQLIQHMDRSQFQPTLVLLKREGDLLAELPDDVAVADLGGARALAAPLALRRLLNDLGADVVCCANNAVNLLVLAATRGMGGGIKVIAADHTPLSVFLATAKWPALRKLAVRTLYPMADALNAPIDEVLDEYRALLGRSVPPVWRLDNPVLPVTPDVPADPGIVERLAGLPRPRVLAAGRLSYEKGMDILLDAAAGVVARGASFSMVIMGDGAERAQLEQQARTLGIGARVCFLGNVPNARSYFGLCDVFALTSRREGFGNALVEALGAGLQVVSVDCPFGPRKILRGGEFGYLTPMGDMNALVGALYSVLTQLETSKQSKDSIRFDVAPYRADVATRAWEDMVIRVVKSA